MRRAVLGVVAVLVPVLALADDQKSVERLIARHVGGLAKRDQDDKLGVAKDAVAIVYGALETHGSISDSRQGPPGAIVNTLGASLVGVDGEHGVAWFQTPFSVDITPKGNIPGDPSLYHTKERFGGIAVLGKDGWQLAAVMYARLVDDAMMARLSKDHNDSLPSADPKFYGDKGLDGVIAGWIKTGFAAHAAADVELIASGTSVAELGDNDAAKALAKTWDGLKLRAATIDSRTYADGAAGYARVKLAMPGKAGGAVEMALGVTAIWQEKEWRWVSLQFSGTHF